MFEKNICLLNPFRDGGDPLYIAHFVLETNPQTDSALRSTATYRVHYICRGHGTLHTPGHTYPLKAGDLFFTFAAEPIAVQGSDGFQYMYISFLGGRGNQLLDRLKIDRRRRIFHHMTQVGRFWETCLSMSASSVDTLCESALLYAFSCLEVQQKDAGIDQQTETVLRIRRAIEEGFSRPTLSLETLAEQLAYNPKYLSAVFKKGTGIGVVDYLQTLRIRHACTMMEQGFRSIADIAQYCGFNDPQYFAKVFKKHTHLTPSEYVKSLHE